VANIAKTLASGSLYALRKPTGRLFIPGAFYGAVWLRVAYMSSRVTFWLILIFRLIGGVLSGGGPVSRLGKKRYYKRVAFS